MSPNCAPTTIATAGCPPSAPLDPPAKGRAVLQIIYVLEWRRLAGTGKEQQ
jgi:hypothetical protein